MSRRKQLGLTSQQERALELMARGRTNYDIANDLGMTLDGAKYHIRQVFDKLGVDSREEAVAAWQASRGSLFERVRGWLWPVGAVAAGGVVVIAAIVVGAIALGGGFGTEKSASSGGSVAPGVWVAEIVPEDPRNPANPGTLKVFKAGDESHAHTFEGAFTSVGPYGLQWSADGRHLAVTGIESGNQAAIRILTRDGSDWTSASTPGNTFLGTIFSWSPNSTLLAVTNPEITGMRTSLVDPSGDVLATIDVPVPADGQSQSNGAPVWSPDGEVAAWVVNSEVVVLKRGDARIADDPGDPEQVARTLVGAPTSTPAPPRDTPDAAVRAAATLPAGAQFTQQGSTADGSGRVYAPFSGLNGPFDPNTVSDSYPIVVEDAEGNVVTFDLGKREAAPQTTLRGQYDVVITK